MAKTAKYTIPNAYKGIQYNTCKNPKCAHYGIHPEDKPDAYAFVYGGKQFPVIKCSACGEMPPIKSNVGIYEEI